MCAWRQVGPATNVANIRLALGYGTAPSAAMQAEVQNSPESAAGMAFLFGAMSEFNERLTFQLTADEARKLIEFVDYVSAVELKKPPDHVADRFVQARWGDFEVRKNNNSVFVWVTGDPGGWEPLPVERFKAGLQRAIADLESLTANPPSADLK